MADRLGIKPGTRALFIGVKDVRVSDVRYASGSRVTSIPPREPVDVVVLQVDSPFALRRVPEVVGSVSALGTLWLLWATDERHIAESHVRSSGAACGFVPVLTMEVATGLSGMKLVRLRRDR